jgi:hypothetical protein
MNVLGLNLATGLGAGRSSRVAIDADFGTGAFVLDGRSHASEAAFLASAGATRTGDLIAFGPYVETNAANLVANGDFTGGTLSGWSSVLNGGSTATVVGGLARLSSDGAAGIGGGGAGMLQAVPTEAGQGYVLEFTRTGGAGSLRVGSTSLGVDLATVSPMGNGVNVVPFGARGASSHVYMFRSAAGNADIDGVSVRAASPFRGFSQKGCIIALEATTPAVASGEKCVLALHNLGNHDVIAVFWDAAGAVRLRVTAGGVVQADLNLGTVAGNTSFSIRVGLSENRFLAQLNGGVVREDTSGVMPGVVHLRLGESPVAGTAWGGGIGRVRIEKGFSLARFFAPVAAVVAIGDSFMGGATGVVMPTTLQTMLGRTVINGGVGGSDMAGIRDRLRDPANAHMRDKTLVLWDGDENGFADVASYCDQIAEIVAALGHQRFLLVPPCVSAGQTDWSVQNAIRNEFVTRWPGHVIDWRDHLTIGGGVLDASMFVNLPTDPVHLSQAAMTLMAEALATAISGRGW